MFQIGDLVSYRAEGVCVLSDIRAERFGAIGEEAEYYILSPLQDAKSVLYVPLKNPNLCALMRPLLSAAEIVSLVTELREERMEWISESRVRNAKYREILLGGDRRELIVLFHTVREQAERARVTGIDEAALSRALELLFAEFSATVCIEGREELISILMGEREPLARRLEV